MCVCLSVTVCLLGFECVLIICLFVCVCVYVFHTYCCQVNEKDKVIVQGDDGDNFYVVDR